MINKIITNLSGYALANLVSTNINTNKNMYIVMSQSTITPLANDIVLSDLYGSNAFAINISGSKIMYDDQLATDNYVEYVDVQSAIIRKLKEVKDPDLVSSKDTFFVYMKKIIKWNNYSSFLFNSYKSQFLVKMDNYVSEHINNIDGLNGIVMSILGDTDPTKKFNSTGSLEMAVFEFIIKINNTSMC